MTQKTNVSLVKLSGNEHIHNALVYIFTLFHSFCCGENQFVCMRLTEEYILF